ncbi:hypothetical protein KXD40_005204 [Peronospora effusa]|nr:hypothetical protein KXD40_005204 [Peronospora effusa]
MHLRFGMIWAVVAAILVGLGTSAEQSRSARSLGSEVPAKRKLRSDNLINDNNEERTPDLFSFKGFFGDKFPETIDRRSRINTLTPQCPRLLNSIHLRINSLAPQCPHSLINNSTPQCPRSRINNSTPQCPRSRINSLTRQCLGSMDSAYLTMTLKISSISCMNTRVLQMKEIDMHNGWRRIRNNLVVVLLHLLQKM